MRCSSLFLGLTALYTASAIPTPADSITVGSLERETLKARECTSDKASYLSDEESKNAARLVAFFRESERSGNPSGAEIGVEMPLFGTANLQTYGYRIDDGGDSLYRDIANGLEACQRDDGIFAWGCHPAGGNGDYYVCLEHAR